MSFFYKLGRILAHLQLRLNCRIIKMVNKNVLIFIAILSVSCNAFPKDVDDFDRLSSSLSNEKATSKNKLSNEKIEGDAETLPQESEPPFVSHYTHNGNNLFFKPNIVLGTKIKNAVVTKDCAVEDCEQEKKEKCKKTRTDERKGKLSTKSTTTTTTSTTTPKPTTTTTTTTPKPTTTTTTPKPTTTTTTPKPTTTTTTTTPKPTTTTTTPKPTTTTTTTTTPKPTTTTTTTTSKPATVKITGNKEKEEIKVPEKPIILKESKPIILKESKPIILKESQPIILKESKPIILKESQPIILKESQPIILKESKPIILKESKPIILKESKPIMLKETDLRLLADYFPRNEEYVSLYLPSHYRKPHLVREYPAFQKLKIAQKLPKVASLDLDRPVMILSSHRNRRH